MLPEHYLHIHTSQLSETSLFSLCRYISFGDKSSPPQANNDPGTDLTSAGMFAPSLSKYRDILKSSENFSEGDMA